MAWWREQIRDLLAERGRVLLVALGVAWGTLSLTVLVAFGTGLDASIHRCMDAAGVDFMAIYGRSTTRAFEGLAAGRSVRLLPDDATALREMVPGVRGASVEYTSSGNPLVHGERRTNARVHAVDPSFGELRSYRPLAGGRFINELDVAERRRVAFLGDTVRRRLFGDDDAVGETVTIRGVPFTVVGELAPRVTLSYYEGPDPEKVLVPASTARQLWGWRHPSYIVVGLEKGVDDQLVVDDVCRLLAPRHRFDPADRDALGVLNRIEENRLSDRVLAGIRVFTAVIGLLGLLVAVVGVANVMVVLVEERRREIGLRMALGARPRDIAVARLLEGLSVTLLGGTAGVVLSAAVLWLFRRLPMDETARAYLGSPEVSWGTALAVTAILGLAGSAAAYLPGRRAARLEPVEVLREE